jgi:hypothetical protein
MRWTTVLVVALLATFAVAKYESEFGKVYDWRRSGQSKVRDAIVGTESTLLLLEDGLIVKDSQGRLT